MFHSVFLLIHNYGIQFINAKSLYGIHGGKMERNNNLHIKLKQLNILLEICKLSVNICFYV